MNNYIPVTVLKSPLTLSAIKWTSQPPDPGDLALAKFPDGKIHPVTSQIDAYPASSSTTAPLPGPTPQPSPGPGPGISGLFMFDLRQVLKAPPGTVYHAL